MARIILIFIISQFFLGCADAVTYKTYANPREKFVTVTGEIDSSLAYVAQVLYASRSTSPECTNYNLMYGRYPQYKAYIYNPSIKNRTHKLTIPLHELDTNTACRWEPDIIKFCFGPSGDTKEPSNCSVQFVVRHDKDKDNLGNKIEYLCQPTTWTCRSAPNYPLTQNLGHFNQTVIVNFFLNNNK